jgi:hypothetical protein
MTHRPTFATCRIVIVSLLATSCGRCVEVKQDTPEATVASLIKLYDAKDDSQWAAVVEPTVMRMTARGLACLSEKMKDYQCTEALIASAGSGFRMHLPDGCPVKMAGCTCSDRGNAAAATAHDFASSDTNAALKRAKLSIESCRITDSVMATTHPAVSGPCNPDFEDCSSAAAQKGGPKPRTVVELPELPSHFWDYICSDIAKEDPLASVTVTCSQGDPLVFILHKKGAKWMVAGFNDETNAGFAEFTMAHEAVTSGKKRESELNKDMK